MFRDESTDNNNSAWIAGTFCVTPYVEPTSRPVSNRETQTAGVYRIKLGRETVWLPPVEYSILRLLAAQPYRPLSKARIAAAVSSDHCRVTASSLATHIKLLRERLGFFRDYIQRVPYMGYRFKA